VKQYFWRQVRGVPFDLYAVALNKESVSAKLQRQKDRLYGYVAALVVDSIPFNQATAPVHVEIDRRLRQRNQTEFNEHLQRQIQERIPPNIPIFIRHMASEESKGIQAADLFCWGIFRCFRQPPDRAWYDVFADRIAFQTEYRAQPTQ
jgi:hypothetical protein